MKKIPVPIWPMPDIIRAKDTEDSPETIGLLNETVRKWADKIVRTLDMMARRVSTGEPNVLTKTADYDVVATDDVLLCNGTFTLSLPPCSESKRKMFYLSNISTGTITIDPNGSETIGGETSVALSAEAKITIISDGSNWYSL